MINQHFFFNFQYIDKAILHLKTKSESSSLRQQMQTVNSNTSNATPSASLPSVQIPKMEQLIIDFLLYHAITIGVVSLISLAMIVHHYGSKKNLKIATKTRDAVDSFMKRNFTNYSGELIEQAPHIIKLYASGRESCIFAIFAFALIPRHQLTSLIFNPIFFNLKDELVIQIPIKTSLNLTLAIIRKKNIREITKKRYPDIKTLCKEYKPTNKEAYNVPETHSILVEKKQHVSYLLATEKQLQIWHQNAKLVKLLYLSDINKFSRYPMALRMVINLNAQDLEKGRNEGLISLLEWMITFVDRMSKVKMPLIDKREAKKRRDGIDNVYDQF